MFAEQDAKHAFFLRKRTGLGDLGRVFPTEKAFLDFLDSGLLDLRALLAVSACSTTLYYYVHTNEEPWRQFGHERLNTTTTWPPRGFAPTWRDTVMQNHCSFATSSTNYRPRFPFYSDLLYQPQLCASVELQSDWVDRRNSMHRIPYGDVTPAMFEDCCRPFIVTGCPSSLVPRQAGPDDERAAAGPGGGSLAGDKALRHASPGGEDGLGGSGALGARGTCSPSFDLESFIELHASQKFVCGGVETTLSQFRQYCDTIRSDETPLFVFDKHVDERCPELKRIASGRTLRVFEDVFDVLAGSHPSREGQEPSGTRTADEDSCRSSAGAHFRPDNRWLLIGNRRSGSRWHKDPNLTSAVNHVLCGRKKWYFLPPDFAPPGVYQSPDGAEVCQSVSIFEWLMNNYSYVHGREFLDSTGGRRMIEGVCGPGEMVFVPRDWWHAVVNLDDWTVAVTENFVTRSIIPEVRQFLRSKADQISGIPAGLRPRMAEEFDRRLEEKGYDCKALPSPAEAARAQKRPAHSPREGAGGEAPAEAAGSFWSGLQKPLSFKRRKS